MLNNDELLRWLLNTKTQVYVIYKTRSWMKNTHRQIEQVLFDECSQINRTRSHWEVSENHIETVDMDVHFVRDTVSVGYRADFIIYEPGVDINIILPAINNNNKPRIVVIE